MLSYVRDGRVHIVRLVREDDKGWIDFHSFIHSELFSVVGWFHFESE